MADQYISDEVRNFILKYIDSVAQLEALLLIRANPQDMWDIPRLATRLYIGEAEASDILNRLCADGLLSAIDASFRFEGISPNIVALVSEVQIVYARQLIPVTNIIHAKLRRIRSFADAFRFRKGS
jgi:hypothetical protein